MHKLALSCISLTKFAMAYLSLPSLPLACRACRASAVNRYPYQYFSIWGVTAPLVPPSTPHIPPVGGAECQNSNFDPRIEIRQALVVNQYPYQYFSIWGVTAPLVPPSTPLYPPVGGAVWRNSNFDPRIEIRSSFSSKLIPISILFNLWG